MPSGENVISIDFFNTSTGSLPVSSGISLIKSRRPDYHTAKTNMADIQAIPVSRKFSTGRSDQSEDKECGLILAVCDSPNGCSEHPGAGLVGNADILGIVQQLYGHIQA
jgi:hypothetical protein